jgi:hypothetical protein
MYLIAWVVCQLKKRQPLNVVPMGMCEEQMKLYWLIGLFTKVTPESLNAGACIEYKN